jgi:hypothetical protein
MIYIISLQKKVKILEMGNFYFYGSGSFPGTLGSAARISGSGSHQKILKTRKKIVLGIQNDLPWIRDLLSMSLYNPRTRTSK